MGFQLRINLVTPCSTVIRKLRTLARRLPSLSAADPAKTGTPPPSITFPQESHGSEQKGFTLIELLIVFVIIASWPRSRFRTFANTKEKAYVASMKQIFVTSRTYEESFAADSAGAYSQVQQVERRRFRASWLADVTVTGDSSCGPLCDLVAAASNSLTRRPAARPQA